MSVDVSQGTVSGRGLTVTVLEEVMLSKLTLRADGSGAFNECDATEVT